MKRTAQKLLSLLLTLALVMGLGVSALAKTSSESIAAPKDDAVVFTVKVGDKVVPYTWADISGKGAFKTDEKTYGAKVDGVQTTQAWTGVALLDLLGDAAKQAGVTLADGDTVKTVAADAYATSFTVGDVKDDGNYMVAPDPAKNYDGDKAYADTYVRILRGDKDTLSNQANIRCVSGVEVALVEPSTDSGEGLKKAQGGDVEHAVFYIAVQEKAGGAVKYYYYTMAELEAYGETHTFTYNDHSVDKSVTAKGASLKSLLNNLSDATVTGDMIVQYAESDGYHADRDTPIDESQYKDKVDWLSAGHTDAGGDTAAAVETVIAYGINEQYAKPDENNVNDPAGVYKDADEGSGYLRAYRQLDSANPAVIKYLMGVVVSPDGRLFTGKDGYTLSAVSTKNEGAAIKTYSAVTGLVPGMEYAVKAPEVNNARLASGQSAAQVITAKQGAKDIAVTFRYDESAYLTLTVDGKTTEYVYTDFLTSKHNVQTPTAEEGAAFLKANGGEIYGYYDTMLYRYNGIWLKDLVGDVAQGKTVTLTGRDGALKTIPAADVDKYFVAYNSTQSKSSTNTPEGKRVTVTYAAPAVLLPGDGRLAAADAESKLVGEKGAKVTVALENVTGVNVGDTAPVSFDDLGSYAWAREAVSYLAGQGVVSGDGKGSFLPANPIRRGDFMLMLVRAYDLKAEKPEGNFADVKQGSYWYDAIAAAKALDIAQGSGDNFNPEGTITRQDAMTLLYRTLSVKGIAPQAKGDLSAYSDGDGVASYARQAVQALVGAEIITGAGGRLSPAATMTRAELSVALYKALTKLG